MEETNEKQKPLPVATPKVLELSLTHPFGPFAARSHRRIRAHTLDFAIQSRHLTQLPVDFGFEPVQRESDGGFADATLSLSNAKEDLAPGEVLVCRLECEGALPPGRYLSKLRIHARDSQEACEVPVVISVAAHWLWVLAFLLCGLLFLGLCALFGEAADLRVEHEKALSLRQALREFAESRPLASAEKLQLAAVEEAIGISLELQSKPRPWTMRDWRLESVERPRELAFELWKEFRSQIGKKRPGAGMIEELEQQWDALSARVEDLKRWIDKPEANSMNADWPTRIRDFGQQQFRSMLSSPIHAIEEEIRPQVERVLLGWAAGDLVRVRDLAPKVQESLRSASRILEERFDLALTWRALARDVDQRYGALAALTNEPGFPESDRIELSARIDRAKNVFASTDSLEAFRDASRILQEPETYALSIQGQVLVETLRSAVKAADEETNVSVIEEALGRFSQADSSQERKAKLLEVMGLWRWKILGCQDESLRKSLLDRVAKISRAIEEGEAPDGLKSVFSDWGAYGQQRVEAARREVILPFCAKLSERLREDLATESEALMLLEPHPTLVGLAEKLDRIRTALDGMDEGQCLETIVGLKGELVEVSAVMFTTLVVQQTASDALARAADSSGVAEARVLAQRMLTQARPLRIALRTPADELYAGRQVMFEIGDLAPEWGTGVKISFDFGDKTPAVERSADQFRQASTLTHRYERPAVVSPRVTAFVESGSSRRAGETVGEGDLKNIIIQPSPVTAAQRLRDQFINARFALALVLALAIQCIRLSSGKPFGGRRLDYAEAFAIGLSIDAGLRVLLGTLTG